MKSVTDSMKYFMYKAYCIEWENTISEKCTKLRLFFVWFVQRKAQRNVIKSKGNRTIPVTKDISEKSFIALNDVFADIFNVLVFEDRQFF